MTHFFRNASRLILCLSMLMGAQGAFAQSRCEDLFRDLGDEYPFAGKLVKTRADQSKIFQVQDDTSRPHYFKEMPESTSFERRIFDDLEMSVIAYRIAHSFNLDTNVPGAILESGRELIVNGIKVKTRKGIYQDGLNDLVTPIDEFKMQHPGREPTARDIQVILNQGSWPRLYSDWKIFWTIFMQADLNIANLSRHGQDLYIFDTGDLANLPQIRAQVGIQNLMDNFDFNMPGKAQDRVSFRPDLRLADPAFKRMAYEIASESDEATAARLGKSLNDSFLAPRAKIRDHVHAMKAQAKWILSLMNKGPFDY